MAKRAEKSRAEDLNRILDDEAEAGENGSRVEGTSDQREEAQARARACAEEVASVLAKHRCRITVVPQLAYEPVGQDGRKVIVTSVASYGFEPLLPSTAQG